MSYPFTATDYTNLNIIQNGNFTEYSLQLNNSGNISFNTDITLNFTLVGGGGGGGGGGKNTTTPIAYPSGGGGSGGASGTYKINLSANDSHIYYVGAGGIEGKANLQGGLGQTSYIDFQGNNILDRVDASGGNPGSGHFNGNFGGAYVEPPTITGTNVIKIVDSSGGAGGNGVSRGNIGPSTGHGTAGSPNNTTSYKIDYTNTTYLGSGGGGADATDTGNPPPKAGNGGGGGNGSTGGIVGTGLDNTLSPTNGGTGKGGNVPGAGGGGGGQPGNNSTTDSSYTPKITFGGSGADGAIYIWFKVYTLQESHHAVPPPPPPPPPIPGRVPTGILPIQTCNSRFAKCNINKKSIYNSGSVTIQGSTLAQRVSTIARTQRKNRVVFQNVSLNGYGQKSGSPYGYGSSPKNTF